MGIFAVLGIKSLAVFGYIAIRPSYSFPRNLTARSVQTIGGWQGLFNYVPLQPIDLLFRHYHRYRHMVLSTATCIADIMRYGKQEKTLLQRAQLVY